MRGRANRFLAWLLPWPAVSALVLTVWLLLNQSLSPGQIFLGLLLALTAPRFLTTLDAPPLRIRRPWALVRLLGNVLPDIFISNYKVTRAILFSGPERQAGHVLVPLSIRSPWSLAMLACILTATPGTAWISFNPQTGLLLMHVLDLKDADELAGAITRRYERWLQQVFE